MEVKIAIKLKPYQMKYTHKSIVFDVLTFKGMQYLFISLIMYM
jgi:hypothetical protein